MQKNIRHSQKGFTLIELLVVIAIIGILATIVLTSLGSARLKANDAKTQGQLSSMRAQAQLYSGGSAAVVSPAIATVPTGAAGGTLFTDNTAADSSLYNLITSLPSGTTYLYGTDAGFPSAGAKWAFAASTSTGSFCVDWTGATKTSASGPVIGTWANFVAATWTCN